MFAHPQALNRNLHPCSASPQHQASPNENPCSLPPWWGEGGSQNLRTRASSCPLPPLPSLPRVFTRFSFGWQLSMNMPIRRQCDAKLLPMVLASGISFSFSWSCWFLADRRQLTRQGLDGKSLVPLWWRLLGWLASTGLEHPSRPPPSRRWVAWSCGSGAARILVRCPIPTCPAALIAGNELPWVFCRLIS